MSEDAPGVEAQLLITLSNCAFMRRVILPRLQETLVRASYPQEEVGVWNLGQESYLSEKVGKREEWKKWKVYERRLKEEGGSYYVLLNQLP